MEYVYRDKIFGIDRIFIESEEDIFKIILDTKQNEGKDSRFFLNYISKDELSKYDFENEISLSSFRNVCNAFDSPLKLMGGYNMSESAINKGIMCCGIKISDPFGNIPGVFIINNDVVIYSPIFPLFYEERDISKFANDVYFTTLTFEQIIKSLINQASKFYVHIGNYSQLKDKIKYGDYILEEVEKEKMLTYVSNPENGKKVYSRHLNLNKY